MDLLEVGVEIVMILVVELIVFVLFCIFVILIVDCFDIRGDKMEVEFLLLFVVILFVISLLF